MSRSPTFTLKASGLSLFPRQTGHGLVEVYWSRSAFTHSLSVSSYLLRSTASTPFHWLVNVRSLLEYFITTRIGQLSPCQTASIPEGGISFKGKLASNPHALPTASNISGHHSLTSPDL